MPKYDVCRFLEKRYDAEIEAESENKALDIAKSMTDEEWGDPDSTIGDQIIVFNKTGDEVANSDYD
jgi:hypothetical protein